MKKILITLSILVAATFAVQAQTNLDSLWNIWIDNTQPDSTRSIALHQYTWEGFLFNDPDSAYSLAKMEYDFAESKGLKAKMGDALNTLGVFFASRSDYVSALSNFHSSFDLFAEISNKKGMAHAANSLGNIYRNIGNASKAIKYYEQSLKFSDEINDVHSSARALANIGTIYSLQSEYAKARDYYLQALKGHNKLDESYSIGGVYSLMGSDYHQQKEYDKAFEYFEKAYASLKDANAKIDLTMLNANRASLFFDMKEYAKAHELLDKTISEMEAIGFQSGINSGKVEKGKFFLQQNQYKEAIEFCSQGFEAFHSYGFLQGQKEACECLYESYKAIGDGTKALIFLEKMNTITDSLDAEETSKKLQQMEFQKEMFADSIAKAEEARLVEEAHQAEVRKKNRTRNIFIGSSLLLLVLGGGIYSRLQYVRKSKNIIEREKDRSNNLLLNILPADIAEELKIHGKAEARDFELVSILFTDFKSFTEASAKMSAADLVGEINTCFEAFDGIIEKYKIEKIKTIGDAYMAAGGLPMPTDDSVKNTVLAALAMQDFIGKRKAAMDAEGKPAFEMRVGIHTGPVVAGIVGVKKFQYDIWGDTVNTAARIESNGKVGKVNISQATYELLKDDTAFTFESRGKIEAKGKGEIEMWFVSKT